LNITFIGGRRLHKDTFDFSVAFLKAYEKTNPDLAGVADQYTGHDNAEGYTSPIPGDRLIDKYKRAYDRAALAGTANGFGEGGRYRGKSFDEALKVQFEMSLPVTVTPAKAPATFSAPRSTFETHLTDLRKGAIDGNTTPLWPNIATASNYAGGMGFDNANMRNITDGSIPAAVPLPSNQSGRYHVYTEVMSWAYSKKYEGFHKHLYDQGLPVGQRGDDIEGDPIIPFVPMYFNYEDSFMEAYGGPARMKEMPEDKRFLVTCSHPVLRAHSTMAESPLLRELTQRVGGGGEYSGNDWGTFALSEIGPDGKIPRPNSSIDSANNFQRTDFKRASWTQVVMNVKDGERLGIKDGDVIEMRNPIGAVRVVVKLTRRIVKGYIALEQGGWYDPDPVDGVDDGGCANTIMCTRGSRLDHGNGNNSAMVSIKKVF
jgi:hypothetical protein